MATVTFLSWNIANFSAKKKGLPNFFEFLTQTALMTNTDYLAILEVVSFMGETLGDELGGRLLNFGKWLYQDSDQFAKHSEQILMFWNTNAFPNVQLVYDMKDAAHKAIEFPTAAYRAPLMALMDIKGLGPKVPVVAFHAPNPGDYNVLQGCANLAKIAELGASSSGVVMGDFNIDPSDPTKGAGLAAFGDLLKIGFHMALPAAATSLKLSAPLATSFNDCCSSQYDNFFFKFGFAKKVTVSAARVDVLTPLVGPPAVPYAKLFYSWYGGTAKAGKVGWSGAPFTNFNDALVAFRSVVSDHVPIRLSLSF
jgi:hypothetical protein